eukprot:COSAG03_NODE_1739_length_3583_cov_9.395809_5_plen_164_part_00
MCTSLPTSSLSPADPRAASASVAPRTQRRDDDGRRIASAARRNATAVAAAQLGRLAWRATRTGTGYVVVAYETGMVEAMDRASNNMKGGEQQALIKATQASPLQLHLSFARIAMEEGAAAMEARAIELLRSGERVAQWGAGLVDEGQTSVLVSGILVSGIWNQ